MAFYPEKNPGVPVNFPINSGITLGKTKGFHTPIMEIGSCGPLKLGGGFYMAIKMVTRTMAISQFSQNTQKMEKPCSSAGDSTGSLTS